MHGYQSCCCFSYVTEAVQRAIGRKGTRAGNFELQCCQWSAGSANLTAVESLRERAENMQLKVVKFNVDIARTLWGDLSPIAVRCLEDLSRRCQLPITSGDILFLEGKWYVTHSGFLGVARRKRCIEFQVGPPLDSATRHPPAGHLKQQSTSPKLIEDSRATATPTPPIFLP